MENKIIKYVLIGLCVAFALDAIVARNNAEASRLRAEAAEREVKRVNAWVEVIENEAQELVSRAKTEDDYEQ